MDFTGITIGGVDIGVIITSVLAIIGAIATIGAGVAQFTATDKDDKFFAKLAELLAKVNNKVVTKKSDEVAVVTPETEIKTTTKKVTPAAPAAKL